MTYLPSTGYLHREMECSFKTQLCRKCYHLLTIKFLCSWVIKMLYCFYLHRAVSGLWVLENSLRESKRFFLSFFFFIFSPSNTAACIPEGFADATKNQKVKRWIQTANHVTLVRWNSVESRSLSIFSLTFIVEHISFTWIHKENSRFGHTPAQSCLTD